MGVVEKKDRKYYKSRFLLKKFLTDWMRADSVSGMVNVLVAEHSRKGDKTFAFALFTTQMGFY